MAEDLTLPTTNNKSAKYESLIPQIKGLIESESDLVANLANVSAALKQGMGFFWVGFYLVKKNELVLGPFQGPVACTRIQKGKGVCGKVWETGTLLVVDDVYQFPGHIPCSSASQSEIVLPVLHKGQIIGVMDIDSDKIEDFDDTDVEYLKELMVIIEATL